MITVGTTSISNELHLLGGLRAGTHEGHLIVFPTADGEALALKSITETKNYYRAILALGLDLIGYEQHLLAPDGPPQSIWYQFEPTKKYNEDVVNIWSGIANTLREAGNVDVADLARHIAFSLRTSAMRLRDCSREYAWQNEDAVHRKIKPNGLFTNLKSFDLDMALHSLLADMGTARDYLAHFISRHILHEAHPVDSMSKLYERAKQGKINIPNTASQSVVDEVRKICEPNKIEGWMARLSEFRNIIIHRAPIGSLAKDDYLVAKPLIVGKATLFQIYFGVPHDPIDKTDKNYVDALTHFLDLLRRLREFAHLVAQSSEVAPTMLTLNDKHLATTPL